MEIQKLIFLTFFDNFLKNDDIYIYGRQNNNRGLHRSL